MRIKIIIIGWFLVTASYAATETLDKVVAVVNSEVITQKEVQEKVALIKSQAPQEVVLPDDAALQKQVLDQLIDRELQLEVAQKAKVEVTAEELNNAIADLAAHNHLSLEQFKQSLAQHGLTFAAFRQQIHDEVLINKVERRAVNFNVNVTDEEIAAFLKTGGEVAPQEYHVLDILVPIGEKPSASELQKARTLAATVAQELRTKPQYQEVVAAHNLQVQDLEWRNLSSLPGVFAPTVSKMQKGEISSPIQAPNGFHVLKVLAVRTKAQAPLTTEKAREILYHKKLDAALQDWLQKLREQSYIKKMD